MSEIGGPQMPSHGKVEEIWIISYEPCFLKSIWVIDDAPVPAKN